MLVVLETSWVKMGQNFANARFLSATEEIWGPLCPEMYEKSDRPPHGFRRDN
jgi:hypothetical protein